MSIVKLDQIRSFLDITHGDDDDKLQLLVDGAEDEALHFLNRASLPRREPGAVAEPDSNTPDVASDSDDLAPSVRMGIYLVVQGMYEAKDANEMLLVRQAAELKWMPYRRGLGI